MILRLILVFFIFLNTNVNYASITPPTAQEVFKFDTKIIDPNTLEVKANIKQGFFLYKNKFKLLPDSDKILELGQIRLPKALKFKQKLIYKNKASIFIDLLGTSPGETFLVLNYQGCSSDGFCYPPSFITIKISINAKKELIFSEIEPQILKQPTNSNHQWTSFFQTHSYIFTLLSFYVMGLLLSFTPCILPMIPVLSSIIIGNKKATSTLRAFLLSLSYVTGMSITYAAIGAIIALLGYNLQVMLQSFWVLVLMSIIFMVLAGAMFDLYEIKLPQIFSKNFNFHKKTKWQYLNVALMGAASILVLSPCVTPPLIGVLSYIAETKNTLHGAISLFFLSLGMGTPLLLIGTSAAKFIPKSGFWMHFVKKIFGLLLLFVAISLLTRLTPSHDPKLKVATNLTEIQSFENSVKHKPYFIEFFANWCESCKVIEKEVLADKEIKEILKNKKFIKIDLTTNNINTQEIMKKYNIVAPPVFIFYDQNGLEKTRLVGEFNKKTFLDNL